MRYLGFIILIFVIVRLTEQVNYRLPNDSIPHHYKLTFIPHIIPGNFTFDGGAEIFLKVLQTTRNLTLNSVKLEIHAENTMLVGEDEIIIPHKHIFDEERQFFILNFRNDLLPGNYKLHLKFTGSLNNNTKGFFWDSYLNKNNETVYLVGTDFETSHARRAFPCWDEPALKATFQISVKHFPNYTALSNMPAKENRPQREDDGKVWTKFKTTTLMSTYIVCFTVSDFDKISNAHGNVSIWARRDVLESMRFAHSVALKTFPILEEYTGIPYIFPKMDIIAIPGYSYGAMENWGLILVREKSMILDEERPHGTTFTIYKYIVHEISHQWFGNLVSPAWWSDIWLTEGLPSYFHYFLTDKLKAKMFPRLMDFFVIDNNDKVFESDEDPFAPVPYQEVNSPEESQNLLITVHNKASTMMHMLSNLISEEVFHTGIKKLLQKYKFKTISTDEFYEIMQETLESKMPQNNFEIKKVMDPYISQSGFPLINVFRNYTTGVIKLTQECPSCNKLIFSENHKWWIPINFATSSSPDFTSTLPTHWMNPEEDELIIEGVNPEDWIIVNIQNSAYYRVNYDLRNWNKISNYLNSDNFTNIHVLNRFQILANAHWLERHNKLDRKLLIDLVSYLVREVDYIPWNAADSLISYLFDYSEKTEDKEDYSQRRRLSTPSGSPSPPQPSRLSRSTGTLTREEEPFKTTLTRENQGQEAERKGWFKSLSRKTKSNSKPVDKKPRIPESEILTTGTEDEEISSAPERVSVQKNLRFFGDTDQESITSNRDRRNKRADDHAVKRRDVTNSSRHTLGIITNPRKPSRLTESALSSGESTTGDSSQQSQNSQRSQRSIVYLHAATVGEIPGPNERRRAASREELNRPLQPQTRTVSRSVSVLAPWRPRNYREPYEINYDQQQHQKPMMTMRRRQRSRETLSRRGKDPRRSKDNLSKTGTMNRSMLKSKDKQKVDRTVSTESLASKSRSVSSRPELNRSTSVPRDPNKSAGWFKLKSKKSRS